MTVGKGYSEEVKWVGGESILEKYSSFDIMKRKRGIFMEKNIKTSDKIFKILTKVMIVLFIVAGALWAFNNYLDKQETKEVINTVEETFGYSSDYSKGNSYIQLNFTIKDRQSLFELSKRSLPNLVDLPDSIIDTLVVNAKFPDGDFQSYYIKFKDIRKLDWDKINNMDGFITYLNFITD